MSNKRLQRSLFSLKNRFGRVLRKWTFSGVLACASILLSLYTWNLQANLSRAEKRTAAILAIMETNRVEQAMVEKLEIRQRRAEALLKTPLNDVDRKHNETLVWLLGDIKRTADKHTAEFWNIMTKLADGTDDKSSVELERLRAEHVIWLEQSKNMAAKIQQFIDAPDHVADDEAARRFYNVPSSVE